MNCFTAVPVSIIIVRMSVNQKSLLQVLASTHKGTVKEAVLHHLLLVVLVSESGVVHYWHDIHDIILTNTPLPEYYSKCITVTCAYISWIICNIWTIPHLFEFNSGPWFNIKMSSYQYRKSHCGDKTVVNWLISTMRFPILVRCHLYIESEPWSCSAVVSVKL